MPRPHFVSNEDIQRWSKNIQEDPFVPQNFLDSDTLKELLFASLWLSEELIKLDCPPILIPRLQYTAGQVSFGKDIWDVHQDIVNKYKNDLLIYEEDPNEVKN